MSSEEIIHHYILYMDIVGSSDSRLDLSEQANRVKAFNGLIKNILSTQESEYSDSTGDGVVISFKHPLHPFIFSTRLHRDLLHYNQGLSNTPELHIRTGISSGDALSVTRFNDTSAPWGRDMVIAKRIMDMANPDQILVNRETAERAGPFNRKYMFKPMEGEHKVKHGEIVRVSSFTFKDEEGNLIGNDKTIICDCHSDREEGLSTFLNLLIDPQMTS